jgi:hypothetical protein
MQFIFKKYLACKDSDNFHVIIFHLHVQIIVFMPSISHVKKNE